MEIPGSGRRSRPRFRSASKTHSQQKPRKLQSVEREQRLLAVRICMDISNAYRISCNAVDTWDCASVHGKNVSQPWRGYLVLKVLNAYRECRHSSPTRSSAPRPHPRPPPAPAPRSAGRRQPGSAACSTRGNLGRCGGWILPPQGWGRRTNGGRRRWGACDELLL